MTTYPAISLHQPWATLCATADVDHDCHDFIFPCPKSGGHSIGPEMVKRFETRSRPCPPKYIGQRVAIHAAARRPGGPLTSLNVGDWRTRCVFDGTPSGGRGFVMSRAARGGGRHWGMPDLPLPLGAVVATAVITASLPIIKFAGIHPRDNPMERVGAQPCVDVGLPGRLDHWYRHDAGFRDISDQLPYGDWTPGRFAWALADVEPLAEPVPWKGRQGFFQVDLP